MIIRQAITETPESEISEIQGSFLSTLYVYERSVLPGFFPTMDVWQYL